jgi:transposase
MLKVEQTTDVTALQTVCGLLEAENVRLLETVRRQRRELAQLRGEDPAQAELALLRSMSGEIRRAGAVAEASAASERSTTRTAQRGHGPRAQAQLLEVVERHELSEGERSCPSCGGELEVLGEQVESSEEITVVLERYVRIRHERLKYRCRCQGAVVTAKSPARLIPGGRYSVDFAVQVATSKYLDHLPLERQVRRMGRLGLAVSSQTLWDQLWALSGLLRPTWQALGEGVLRSPVVHADETRWPLLDRQGRSASTVWSMVTPETAYYRILGSKSESAGRELLGRYRGTVVADGYQVYESLSRAGPEEGCGGPRRYRLAHCWAHVLRKFRDDQPRHPRECAEILHLIGELYEVEGEGVFPGSEAEQRDRLRRRQERSAPIVARIRQWALSQHGLPRSDFGLAVRYLLERWPGLTLFLEDARIPLDNNPVERALRGPVVGRKNHYGSKSARGCEVAAIFYTLCETAKLRGIDPHRYLRTAALRALEQPGTITLPEDPFPT